jgi:hypothetical protein
MTRKRIADRLLMWADISPRPFRGLTRAYALMDFRSQEFGRATATGPKALISPLFWVVGQFLLLSGLVCAVLFARTDAYFFTLVNLGVSMLMMATSVIVEFNEVVLDPGDIDIIGHQPVPVRTYSAARVANLLGYVLLMTAALNLFPAIAGLGLRDAGWDYLLKYSAAAFVGNFAVVASVLLIYTLLLKGRPGESAKELLAWTQIILIMVVFYGGQAVFRDPHDQLEMVAYNLPDWVAYLPVAWLAHFVATDQSQSLKWSMLAGGIVVNIALWSLTLWRLSRAYSRMQPSSTAWRRAVIKSSQGGALGGMLTSLLTRSREERAAFWLCSTQIRRDNDLRMRSLPSLGVVLALLALGLFTGKLGDPFINRDPAYVIPIACIYLLAFPVPTIIHNLNFSRDHQASWLLWTAPVRDKAAFVEGMRKAVSYKILLPLVSGMMVVFAFAWGDLLRALIHSLIGWIIVIAAGHAAEIGIIRRFPFSSPGARGAVMGGVAMFAAITNAAAMLLAVVHYYAIQSQVLFALYVASLAIMTAGLRFISRQVIRRRFAAFGSYE